MCEKFTENDTTDNLSDEKLKILADSNNSLLLACLEKSIFDVERIRLLLELGIIEAKHRLQGPQ
jgi:hypothetical protein